jgi:hypothetical protein
VNSVDLKSSTVHNAVFADSYNVTHIYQPGSVEAIAQHRPAGIDCPSLPGSFLRRPAIYDRAFAELNKPGPSFCIMIGESGCGKTSCASEIYTDLTNSETFAGIWIDCRLMVYNEADLTITPAKGKRTLIVIDFLNSEDHPIVANGFFERYCQVASFLIITNSETVLTKVLQIKGLADRRDEATIRFERFSKSEVYDFVQRSTGLQLSDKQIDLFFDNTKGYPQFCQMICGIICSERCDASEVDRLSSAPLLLSQLLSEWMVCCLKSPIAESVINCLLHVPFVGLTSDVIATTIEEEERVIVSELKRLERMGVVAAVQSIFTENKLYYIHDVIRSLRDSNKCDDEMLLQWRQRYLSLLKEKLSCEKLTVNDLLPCLDAWVAGWASVFERKDRVESDPQGFLNRFSLYEEMLPTLLPAMSHCFKEAAEQIAVVLRPHIHSDMACQPLTGLGHMLRDVKANYLVADIMWNAVYNDDAWGRASALGVCVSHWKKLGAIACSRGLRKLDEWLARAQENCERKVDGWHREQYPAPGLDLLVVLSGFARLGSEDKALENFSLPRFRENFGDCYAVNGMMLLRLWRAGAFSATSPKNLMVYEILTKRIIYLNETYLRIFDFLVLQQNIEYRIKHMLSACCRECKRYKDETSLSLDIGRYADCSEFVEFVRAREPDARYHF